MGTTTNALAGIGMPAQRRPPGDGHRHRSAGPGIVYQYVWPGFSGSSTNFFQVSVNGGPFIAPDQRPGPGDQRSPVAAQLHAGNIPLYPGNVVPGNFTVNPLNGNQVIISSNAGRIFETLDRARPGR